MRKTAHTGTRRAIAHGVAAVLALAIALVALAWAPAPDAMQRAWAEPAASSSAADAESDEFLPVTDGGNAEKYLKDIKGEEAVEEARDDQAEAEADARGHWEYEDVETIATHQEKAAPQNPGTAIAVASVALSGYGRTGGLVGPSAATANARRHTKPPDVGKNGDWTVYNRVMAAIPNHAVGNLYTDCSATVALTIWWSGVDDGFCGANTVAQARYMAGSSKWDRVGGSNAYWHRRSGTGDGFTLQPGDVLVGKPCVTEGRRTHIFIYTGTEISNLKYPGADYTIFESHMAKSWPGMQQNKPIPNATVDYAVYRRNNKDLDIDGSRFSGYYLEEKVRYSPETRVVEEKSSEKLAVRYVYTEYDLRHLGLPMGSSTTDPKTFLFDTETFDVHDPLLPAGYVFDGWYTSEYLGARIDSVHQGTSHDVELHAHVHEDRIHQLEYYQDIPIPQKEGVFIAPLRRTFSTAELGLAAAAVVALIAGGIYALRRRSQAAKPTEA